MFKEFYSLLERDPNPVVVLGVDHSVDFSNHAATDVLGDHQTAFADNATKQALQTAWTVSNPVPVTFFVNDRKFVALAHRLKVGQGRSGLLIRIKPTISDWRFKTLSEQTEKLRQEMEQRRLYQSRLSHIFQTTGEGLLLVDAAGNILQANPKFSDMVQQSVHAIIRKHLSEVLDLGEKQERLLLPGGAMQRLAAGNVSFETFANSPKGAVPVDIICSPPSATLDLYVILVRDLSPSKRYLEAVNVADRMRADREKALEGEKEKAQIISTLAHEMRTPLNGVSAALDLLMRDMSLNDGQRRLVDIARRSGDAALRQMNSVLSFLKAESAGVLAEESQFFMGELLDDVLAQFEVMAEQKNVKLSSSRFGPFDKAVSGQFDYIFIVLQNLISNALKFTDQGEVQVGAVISPPDQTQTCDVAIEVRDTGCGIPKARLKQIFTPFHSVAPLSDVDSGVGLGLSIVENLVAKLGGKLDVESEEGVGTVFKVDLNLAVVGQGPKQDNADQSSQVSKAIDMVGQTVLFADDNPINRDILREILTRFGATAIEARDGEEVMYLLDDVEPDHILLDIHMPNMNGYQAANRIRKRPDYKGANIIGLSAFVDASIRKDGLKSGMSAVIEKPINLVELATALKLKLIAAEKVDFDTSGYFDDCLDDVRAAIAKARHGWENRDFTGIVEVVHRVQGAASMLSLGALAQALISLERLARDHSDQVGFGIEDVQYELDALLKVRASSTG